MARPSFSVCQAAALLASRVPRVCAPLLMMALTTAVPCPAQADTFAGTPEPVITVTGGLGNAMGWYGAQGEGYFAHGRLSAFGGLGYTPATDEFDPSGVTVAAGLRGYTGGRKHRGFMELSACQVATLSDPIEPKRFYGPCGQLGYQLASRSGFTFVLSTGVGYAVGAEYVGYRAKPLIGLGLGYTWRRSNAEAP